jgi:Bacterial pre-peptidase C-terminal domain
MNTTLRRSSLLGLVLLGLGATGAAPSDVTPMAIDAGGDTCATATTIATLPYNDNGDTSTATNQILFLNTTCAGLGMLSREGPDRIYSFTVTSGNSVTITVTPSASYDVDIYLLGTCGNGNTCVHESDSGIEGQAETIGPVTLAPGTYYLYVDSVYPIDDKLGSGTYSLSMTGNLGVPNNASFYTIVPCRVLDTRNTAPPALSAGAVRTFSVGGTCGVPMTAKSVSINVTVTQPTAAGFVVVFPGGAAVPNSSTINFRAGQTRANNAIVPLGTNASISAVSGQPPGNTVHFILDVNGYFQ